MRNDCGIFNYSFVTPLSIDVMELSRVYQMNKKQFITRCYKPLILHALIYTERISNIAFC